MYRNGTFLFWRIEAKKENRKERDEKNMEKNHMPIWEKPSLTLKEASEYTGIGVNKLREISNQKNCDFVFWVGQKRMFKRELLDKYLKKIYSI